MTTSPLSIALTGITGFAGSYLRLLDNLPEDIGRLRAVTAINRAEHEALCADLESKGVEVFTDFHAMIGAWRGRIDLCILPVPIHLHLPMTRAALEADMHVLLEKPLAGSVAEGEAIAAADRESGGRVAVGFQDLYAPSTHRIARDLAAGRIGRVEDIRMKVFWPRGEAYYTRNRWAGRLSVDGAEVRDSPINNATAHFVNLALFFAGAVGGGSMAKADRVEAELFRCRDIESFDTAALRVRTDADVPLFLYASHSTRAMETATLEVRGGSGRLVWTQGVSARWILGDREETEAVEPQEEVKALSLRSVLDSVRTGTPFQCTPDMALSHTRLVELLHGTTSIRRIPGSRLERIDHHGDPHVFLPGLEADLHRCFESGALPSERGLDWAG